MFLYLNFHSVLFHLLIIISLPFLPTSLFYCYCPSFLARFSSFHLQFFPPSSLFFFFLFRSFAVPSLPLFPGSFSVICLSTFSIPSCYFSSFLYFHNFIFIVSLSFFHPLSYILSNLFFPSFPSPLLFYASMFIFQPFPSFLRSFFPLFFL